MGCLQWPGLLTCSGMDCLLAKGTKGFGDDCGAALIWKTAQLLLKLSFPWNLRRLGSHADCHPYCLMFLHSVLNFWSKVFLKDLTNRTFKQFDAHSPAGTFLSYSTHSHRVWRGMPIPGNPAEVNQPQQFILIFTLQGICSSPESKGGNSWIFVGV